MIWAPREESLLSKPFKQQGLFLRNSQIIASSLLSLQNTWEKSKISSCCLIAKSCPTLAITWTVAYQACLSMQFPKQEYWSVLPFPPPGNLPDPGMEPSFPCIAGGFFMSEPPGKLKSISNHGLSAEEQEALRPQKHPLGVYPASPHFICTEIHCKVHFNTIYGNFYFILF